MDEYGKSTLDEAQFWDLISLLPQHDFETRVIEEALAAMPVKAIEQFEEILSHQLFQIDGKKYADIFYDSNDVSADGFLYWRCEVVAQGKDFFRHFLETPFRSESLFPFESLLYVAERAYQIKTDLPFFDFVSKYSYETGSNRLP